MGTFGSNLRVPIEMPNGTGSGNGNVLVGTDISDISLDTTGINNTITADSSDIIANPQWTDLITLTGKLEIFSTANSPYSLSIPGNSTAGNSLRGQIQVDGIAVWDCSITSDGATSFNLRPFSRTISSIPAFILGPIYCNNSFKIRAARHGTQDSTSTINTSSWYYTKLA